MFRREIKPRDMSWGLDGGIREDWTDIDLDLDSFEIQNSGNARRVFSNTRK